MLAAVIAHIPHYILLLVAASGVSLVHAMR
jgi:hypothetical protein